MAGWGDSKLVRGSTQVDGRGAGSSVGLLMYVAGAEQGPRLSGGCVVHGKGAVQGPVKALKLACALHSPSWRASLTVFAFFRFAPHQRFISRSSTKGFACRLDLDIIFDSQQLQSRSRHYDRRKNTTTTRFLHAGEGSRSQAQFDKLECRCSGDNTPVEKGSRSRSTASHPMGVSMALFSHLGCTLR